jgi:hypothetical protein
VTDGPVLPIGELEWTSTIDIITDAAVRVVREAFAEDGIELPEPLRDASEWAAWRCIDASGAHWSALGNSAVVRAAVSAFGVEPGVTYVTRQNWWVDGIPHEAFPVRMPGWPSEWPR